MDLLLLFKAGWALTEEGLSLPQCLCTSEKQEEFSLINPPTIFTIKVGDGTEFFFCRPWFIHFGTFITIQLAFAFCSLTELSFSELLGGGKAKASTGDGHNTQAQEPGGTRCFISCNSDKNQVGPFSLFVFFYICSASTELGNSKSTLGRNMGGELQFTKVPSCPWPFHSSPCTGCWASLLNASLELGRDEKLSIIKRIAFQMKINTNPPVEASRATCRSIQMWEQEEGFVFWDPVRYSTGTLHVYQRRYFYCKCISVLTSKC